MALHLDNMVRELGTSLQLMPSYENTREFEISPPATQTPLPTPDVAVMAAPATWSAGAYAIARTFIIIVVPFATGVHRIPF